MHPSGSHRREAAILSVIHSFRRTLTEFQRRLATATGQDISMADATALQHLAHVGEATPGTLAAFTGLTSGSVTVLLDRLEGAGFVARHRSKDDKRKVLVRLVPGARQRLMAAMVEAHHAVGTMFDGWQAKEIEQLAGLLDRLDLSSR